MNNQRMDVGLDQYDIMTFLKFHKRINETCLKYGKQVVPKTEKIPPKQRRLMSKRD